MNSFAFEILAQAVIQRDLERVQNELQLPQHQKDERNEQTYQTCILFYCWSLFMIKSPHFNIQRSHQTKLLVDVFIRHLVTDLASFLQDLATLLTLSSTFFLNSD